MCNHREPAITFADKPHLQVVPDPVELTMEDFDTLSTLVLQRLNALLQGGVYHHMELLDVDAGAFHEVHKQEAAKLQRLGMKLCQLSLNL